MIGLILKRAQMLLNGPERNFTVLSVEIGDEYIGRYSSLTPSWGGGFAHAYMDSTRLRPITVALEVDGIHYEIEGVENIESVYEQSAYRLYPKEVAALQKSVGQTIRTRIRNPYSSKALEKLAKVSRGESA